MQADVLLKEPPPSYAPEMPSHLRPLINLGKGSKLPVILNLYHSQL